LCKKTEALAAQQEEVGMRREIGRDFSIAIVAIASLLVHSAVALPPQKGTSRQVRTFLRLLRPELAAGNGCGETMRYVRDLPIKQQLALARAIVNDPDARIGYIGANILIAHGHTRDAVPGLAAILASGRAETQLNGRFGYDWVHSDDDRLFPRLIVEINRYLLANLSKYTGEERKRVEYLLMGGLGNTPSEPSSEAKAKKLISEWEAELGRRR
jgi:hypothetical protein